MCVAARQINENNYYTFESTWARAPFLGSKLFTVRMLVDAVVAPRFLTRRCIWRSRRKTAEEASESRPPARRGADDKEMPDPTNAHTALLRQKRQCEQSKHAVRMQCCVASCGCVAWRVVWRRRGGSGACCGRGGGKEKNPSGECARAVSGRIKYGRSSSEDAQAGGASVRLPRLLYFTLRCVCRAGRQGAGETGCRWRNRDYRHPLEVTPIKTVAGQPMWHCEHCGCAKSVCTADKRVCYAARAQNFLAFPPKNSGAPVWCRRLKFSSLAIYDF